MTREEGPERTQRTVAELLAKYGANSEESTPRRRRRRAEDAEETAPQAIIDRVLSDSGEIPRIRDEDQPPPAQAPPPPARAPGHAAPTTRHRPVPQPAQQPPPPAPQAASAPPAQPPPAPQPTQRQMPPVAPPERRAPERRQETRQPEQRRMPPQNSQPLPRPQQPQPSGQWPAPPVDPSGLAARLDGRQESRSDLRPVRNEPPPSPPMPEGATEVMPRIPDEPPPGHSTGQHPVPHRVSRTARTAQPSMPLPQPPPPVYPQHEPDEPDYPTEYHGFDPVPAENTQFVQGLEQEEDDEYDSGFSVEHDRPVGEDDEFRDDDYPDGEDESEKASPLKQWLSMAGQLAIGVIGGAALWLGFNWLWGKLPAAALIVALAVIIGLVWVVRKIRRADDLQTTILTVLVGLVVTVSPAAMLLLSR